MSKAEARLVELGFELSRTDILTGCVTFTYVRNLENISHSVILSYDHRKSTWSVNSFTHVYARVSMPLTYEEMKAFMDMIDEIHIIGGVGWNEN